MWGIFPHFDIFPTVAFGHHSEHDRLIRGDCELPCEVVATAEKDEREVVFIQKCMADPWGDMFSGCRFDGVDMD